MRDNPAALIVNPESYDQISSRFDPIRFDIPQVARVRTFSATREEAIKIFLIDGNTRTKYVNDHREDIGRDFPRFKFQVRDVTVSLLDNPKIVASDRRIPGRQYLELDEWLRAVIPPTVEHSRIAPDRIAAYLINGWDNMVGPELAGKFSAIAALSLLKNQRVPIATDTMFSQYLSRQDEIMADENQEERRKLEGALLQMVAIIRQTRLLREHIAESAFILVAAGSSAIGGEREALKQIYGLLHLPTVEQKLGDGVGKREQLRQELGTLLAEAFKRFINTPNREQIINVLGQAVRDPQLTFEEARDILTAANSTETYDFIRQGLNARKLERTYLGAQKRQQLTEEEAVLVANLGRKTYLDERSLSAIVRSIAAASQALNQAHNYRSSVLGRREQLQNSGARPQTIDEALAATDRFLETVFSTNTQQALLAKVSDFQTGIAEVEKKITRELAIHKASQIADAVYGYRLQNGQGALIRARIALYLATEFGKIDSSNEVQVKAKVGQLASLDEDLHTKVITGEIRLHTALNAQQARKKQSTSVLQSTPVPAQPQIPSHDVRPIDVAKRLGIQPPVSPIIEEYELHDKGALEERRKRLNNERLQQAARSFINIFEGIDLDQSEVATETCEVIEEMLQKVGKVIFSHPDVVRIIKENPKLLEELKRAREGRHYKERTDTDRDARTQI